VINNNLGRVTVSKTRPLIALSVSFKIVAKPIDGQMVIIDRL